MLNNFKFRLKIRKAFTKTEKALAKSPSSRYICITIFLLFALLQPLTYNKSYTYIYVLKK